MQFIGREKEKQQLQRAFDSAEAELIAIYGRRRVGKTFLIRSFFQSKKCLFFQSSGILKGKLRDQLNKFREEIHTTFYRDHPGIRLAPFRNWHEAFRALTDAVGIQSSKQPIAIFLDELPWMATRRSGLLEALDYYWNRHWSADPRMKVVICGSAASWVIENIVNNTGGLHNRVTLRLRLEPFLLSDIALYLKTRKIRLDHQQILTLYMCLGGVPFYWRSVQKGLSAAQNISELYFKKNGPLREEFVHVFRSLFRDGEAHEHLIRLIARKRSGISRADLSEEIGQKGGMLSKRLRELEEAGFITAFIPSDKERGLHYRVIDEHTLFYLTWMDQKSSTRIRASFDDSYWETLSQSPAWASWAGYAFEAVCFKHLFQIQTALKIPAGSEAYTWRLKGTKDKPGAQIDLIFDRPDGVINLCEIKHSVSPYHITKDYARRLLERERLFAKETNSLKQIVHSFICSGGLKQNLYAEDIVSSSASLEDLF